VIGRGQGAGVATPSPQKAMSTVGIAGPERAPASGMPDTGAPTTTTAASGGGAGGDASTAAAGSAPTAVDASLQPKVVRTGSLSLVVRTGTFDDATAKVTALADGLGGMVSSSQTTSLGNDPQGTLTLRVPVAQFDRVLAGLRRIGTVTAVTTSSDDVTAEYSDVGAQIKALQAERDQILLVLDRATNVPDILAVRDRLTAVQSELDQLQGRQKLLADQTSYATITVSISEVGSPTTTTTVPVARHGLGQVWHDSVDRFGRGARAIALGLATMAPWLLLLGAAWLVLRAWWRRPGTATRTSTGTTTGTTTGTPTGTGAAAS